MPVRAVTSRFMYRGLCSIPDILSYRAPVSLPEDEVEGKWYFILSWTETLSVGIVLCECGVQHHGERPAAASTVHIEESACFFSFTLLTYFIFFMYICCYELCIFSFRLCWFWNERMNKRHHMEIKACNMKGEGGRSYLNTNVANDCSILTLMTFNIYK